MKVYAVELTGKTTDFIHAHNIKLFKKFQIACVIATTGTEEQDLRVEVSTKGVSAKVYDAKKGHVDYVDAEAWITPIEIDADK